MAYKKYKDLVAECRNNERTVYIHNNGWFDLIKRASNYHFESNEITATETAKGYERDNRGLLMPIRVLVTDNLLGEDRANPSKWYENSPNLFIYDSNNHRAEAFKKKR